MNRSPKNTANLDTVQEIEIAIVDSNKQSSENKDSTNCHDNSGVEWCHIFALPDLFLLENQIPFFVVRALYEVLVGPDKENTLTENISYYIEGNLQYLTGAFGTFKKPNDFCHLLHLFHMHFTPRMVQEECNHLCPQKGENFLDRFGKFFSNISRGCRQDELNSSHIKQFDSLQSGKVTRWRRAAQYHEAGIVFKRKEFDGRNSHSLLDVMFRDGVLEIPCLYIDDISGSFLRNLIAFEQTNPHFGNSVTAYIMFMSQLISRPDDVNLLSQRGIIMHHLHSDMVVSILFTRLTKGVVFDFTGDFYLRSICWKMEMYYQNRMNRWVAWLRHNHLSNPWLGLALLAGLLVLVCTIVQTVLTVLAYMRP
ncbi:hypothetical protein PR202_gb23446 [Eleusine coracana subsp. coracana]|uniref:Uncharacterized protein n=1 Tax=Eleusine coracana subsp. coracana TaxID=191504 RepID=A0AAV5FI90_ELECO|nr:hypothetical protein QOZ80_6BG0478170 [Eleusine coracana subsp. coracana]GJN34751.1 hypothetical protein PR202_gb23446 [Eleusine coracana subsp. coracana]